MIIFLNRSCTKMAREVLTRECHDTSSRSAGRCWSLSFVFFSINAVDVVPYLLFLASYGNFSTQILLFWSSFQTWSEIDIWVFIRKCYGVQIFVSIPSMFCRPSSVNVQKALSMYSNKLSSRPVSLIAHVILLYTLSIPSWFFESLACVIVSSLAIIRFPAGTCSSRYSRQLFSIGNNVNVYIRFRVATSWFVSVEVQCFYTRLHHFALWLEL